MSVTLDRVPASVRARRNFASLPEVLPLPNLIETQSIHRRDGLNDCAGKGLTLHCARKERAVLVEDRIPTGYPCAVCADAPSCAGHCQLTSCEGSTVIGLSPNGHVISEVIRWIEVAEQLKTIAGETLLYALNCVVENLRMVDPRVRRNSRAKSYINSFAS